MKISKSSVNFEHLWREYNPGRRAGTELPTSGNTSFMITQVVVCDQGLSAWLAPVINDPPQVPLPYTFTRHQESGYGKKKSSLSGWVEWNSAKEDMTMGGGRERKKPPSS